MSLFEKEFLDKLEKAYENDPEILDYLIDVHGLKFRDAILILARFKKINPGYIQTPKYKSINSLVTGK